MTIEIEKGKGIKGMDIKQENILKAGVLVEIAEALSEGAAGPCDYWYKRLAKRLIERARKILEKEA